MPLVEQPLSACGTVRRATLESGRATVRVVLGFPCAGISAELRARIEAALLALDGVDEATVELESKVETHAVQRNLKPLPGVANIVAVASGKGGVGKSTTAVNVALALAAEGAAVGLLDADIYGPSQPRMLGLAGEHPVSHDGKRLEPLEAHGLQAMSIGFLVDEDQPMVWRGPMVTQALNQILADTDWGRPDRPLDYLIVDMPPGTGDIQLTLAQRVPVAGALIVTTPQDIALTDAVKGLNMFRRVSVPVLGIVENMSIHRCSACGHEEHIFGEGGGASIAARHEVELLGSLPLEAAIREQTDSGRPTVVAAPDGPAAAAYRRVALRAAAALAASAKDYSQAFPDIVVEDT